MTAHPTKPEVLAPAGSPQALAAALQHGADAVYFGLADGFNARARATNFKLAELPAVCARIHRAGARAYLTLNTLIFEPELEAVERVLRQAAASGIDALIVQDPAVCLLAQVICPELELHASTQMTIAEPAAAEFARQLGVSRVVVPRELSVAEIARFAAETDIELEVFVHGALCVSWSGQCLTSEAWGGRSANRGQCAQSCRMPYDLVVDGKPQDLGAVRYLLSPKDLTGARAIPDLLDKVHGLKIEGRQKGPQYVATATGGYRRWVDALVSGGDRKAAEKQLAGDLLKMALSYTRGSSDGFLAGSDHQTLVEGTFPKHRGVYVGSVSNVHGKTVFVQKDDKSRPWTGGLSMPERPTSPVGELSAPLSTSTEPAALQVRPGMGIVFDQGHPEDPNEPGGPVFYVDDRGTELRLGFGDPGPDVSRVKKGDRVFVTNDPALAAAGREASLEPSGRVGIALTVSGAIDQPLQITATCGAFAARASSASPLQQAKGTGLDRDLVAAKLGAFGGTPFRLDELDIEGLAPGLHLAPGELKDVRRRLTAELLPQVERGPVRRVEAAPALARVRERSNAIAASTAPAVAVPLVRLDAQLEAAIAAGCPEIELDWMEFTGLGKAVARARDAGVTVTIATTRIGKPGEEALVERIRKLEPDGILVRHIGALMRCLSYRRAGDTFALHGDFSLNAANSVTTNHLLQLGLDTVTASLDLDEQQLLAMFEHTAPSRVAVIAHHRIPTFHTEHCVYAHLLGNGRDYRTCGRPCEKHQVALRDHLGREHPVIVDVGCRNTVFHHAPQQSAAWTSRLLALGVRRFRVEFVRETGEEVGRTLAAWRELLAGKCSADSLAQRTGATSQVGVAQGGMRLLVE